MIFLRGEEGKKQLYLASTEVKGERRVSPDSRRIAQHFATQTEGEKKTDIFYTHKKNTGTGKL